MKPQDDRFVACAAAVMQARGAFVPRDPLLDGPSAHGIGLGLLSVWVGGPADAGALASLPMTEATLILRQMVWAPLGGGQMPAGLDLALFAYAVEAGTMRALSDLQDELGVPVSGAPDAATLAAVAGQDAGRLAHAVRARHAAWRRSRGLGAPPRPPAPRRRTALAAA